MLPDLKKLWSQAAKVKLSGGLVTKLSRVLIFVVVGIAAIAAPAAWNGGIVVPLIGIVLIVGIVFVLGWRMIDFADDNPVSALLEGSEFLLHQQLQMQAKGGP